MSIVLMTGTLCPPQGARELTRTDVNARIDDYRKALAHNLSLLQHDKIDGLVFVENSGFGMDRFADMVAKVRDADRLELISYNAAQPPRQTRFAGECHLLKHAFTQSRVIRAASGNHVWKVTGRYIVPNLLPIMAESEVGQDLIVHCRDHPMRYVDFGVAGFRISRSVDIIDRILATTNLDELDERMLRDLLDDGRFADLAVRQRFSRIPDFRGIRGNDNSSYSGLRYRSRYLIRSLAHRLVPRVWL